MPHLGPNAASKAALIHLTRSMALEWGRHGLNANALRPGYVRTELNGGHWESEDGQKLLLRLPRRRLADIGDLPGAQHLLCIPGSRFINGAVLAFDDGLGL